MTESGSDARVGVPSVAGTRYDVVVDVAATSRAGGRPDTAAVSTAVALADGSVVRTTLEHDAEARGDDTYRFEVTVPAPPAVLEKGAPWTLLVVLPGPTGRWRVELVHATDAPPPTRSDTGGRLALAWVGEQDPTIEWVWRYTNI